LSSGVNAIKLIYFVTTELLTLTRGTNLKYLVVAVSWSVSQRQAFSGKSYVYKSGSGFFIIQLSTLLSGFSLFCNDYTNLKNFPVANTLAYFIPQLGMNKKGLFLIGTRRMKM
jgi:hypothetical protein